MALVGDTLKKHGVDVGIFSSVQGNTKLVERRYWPEFDGLRAYLALWVFIWHFLGMVGHSDVMSFYSNIIPSYAIYGTIPVKLFIILSGFVITSLIYYEKESYFIYIIRRFLRLWPAHFTVLLCIFGYYAIYFPHLTSLHSQHLFIEGTFLNGIIPTQLMSVPTRLNGPNWSISLEMQFYLIAPFILAIFMGSKKFKIAGVTILIVFLALGMPQNWGVIGTHTVLLFRYDSFIGLQIQFFLIGSLCFYFAKNTPTGKFQLGNQLVVIVIILGLCRAWIDTSAFSDEQQQQLYTPWLARNWIDAVALVLWVLIFSSIWASKKWTKIAFCNPVAAYLGKISYSIYVSHLPVLIILKQRANFGEGGAAELMFFMIALTVVLSISSLLHHFVEVPAINLGKKIKRSRQRAP